MISGGLDEGHRTERAEASAERDLLVRREALPAEEHDLVIEDGASHLGDDVVVEVVRQVDATDDRPARARDRLDRDPPIPVSRRRGRYRDQWGSGRRSSHPTNSRDAAYDVLAGDWVPP